MNLLLDVINVHATSDHKLELEFENGEKKVFDMKPYLSRRPFGPLIQVAIFKLAKVENGTVVWPGDLDVAPETLYEESTPVPGRKA